MFVQIRRKLLFFLLSIVLSTSLVLNIVSVKAIPASYSIELEDFRWNRFPLKVLVNMNEWSTYDYAVAVHEALDDWIKSIWNYTQSYSNSTLPFNYLFYVNTVNSTIGHDILISFTQNEFNQNAVGLTTFKWDPRTHTAITPITVNITTYSTTAGHLFIKNVAMHELGHAFGLGHADSQTTTNGPELMYPSSSLKQIVYPSTLDIYGLTMLYNGAFSQKIQLPFKIPYIMLAEGNTTQNQILPQNILYVLINEIEAFFANPQEALNRPMILFTPSILGIAISIVFGLLFHSEIKAIIASIVLIIFVDYLMALIYLFDVNPASFGLILFLLLPSILIGTSIGGFVSHKIGKRKINTINIEPG